MKRQDIIDAWVKMRKIDNTIPDEVLDFMRDAAIEKLGQEVIRTSYTYKMEINEETKKQWIRDGLIQETEDVHYEIVSGEPLEHSIGLKPILITKTIKTK